MGRIEIDAGKLRLKARGYFSTNDRGASEGVGVLSAVPLGASSDPWGIALHAPRFSCAATTSEFYSSAAFQWLVFEAPLDLILGAGALYEMNRTADIAQRIRPWFALGLRHTWGTGEARLKSQIYPEWGRAVDSSLRSALRGAAARVDLACSLDNFDARIDAYLETGEFLNARGTVSTYDAAADVAFGLDLSSLPLLSRATLSVSAKSVQGLHSFSIGQFPAYGTFADPFISRYWLDIGTVEATLSGKRLPLALFTHDLAALLACGASFQKEFSTTLLSLNAKISLYALAHPECTLSFETKLSGEKSDATEDYGANSSFSAIEELELSENRGTAIISSTQSPLLNHIAFSVRGSGPNLSLSGSVFLSLSRDGGEDILGRLRASIKLPHCAVEASSSVKYAGTPPRFSISSARLYMRIPF